MDAPKSYHYTYTPSEMKARVGALQRKLQEAQEEYYRIAYGANAHPDHPDIARMPEMEAAMKELAETLEMWRRKYERVQAPMETAPVAPAAPAPATRTRKRRSGSGSGSPPRKLAMVL